jgi:hypothetical protein
MEKGEEKKKEKQQKQKKKEKRKKNYFVRYNRSRYRYRAIYNYYMISQNVLEFGDILGILFSFRKNSEYKIVRFSIREIE